MKLGPFFRRYLCIENLDRRDREFPLIGASQTSLNWDLSRQLACIVIVSTALVETVLLLDLSNYCFFIVIILPLAGATYPPQPAASPLPRDPPISTAAPQSNRVLWLSDKSFTIHTDE